MAENGDGQTILVRDAVRAGGAARPALRFLRLDHGPKLSDAVLAVSDTIPVSLHRLIGREAKASLGGLIATFLRAALGRVPRAINAVARENLARRRIAVPRVYDLAPLAIAYRRSVAFRALLLLNELRRASRANAYTGAIVYNGSLVPQNVLALHAEETGMARVYLEGGFFPGTLQVDPKGINGNNSVPRDPAFYRAQAAEFGPDIADRSLNRRKYKRTPGDTSAEALPPRYVFVPFQVPSDMQIRNLSPWVADMHAFHRLLERLAKDVPGTVFVIKEHPSFRRSLTTTVEPNPAIHFFNDRVTGDLIRDADAVLTINSTVGMEGLMLGKKVITLGNACYNVEGIVRHADGYEELRNAIAGLNEWHPDERLREDFLRYIRNCYLVEGSFRDLPLADLLARFDLSWTFAAPQRAR
ncbi:hypothetical protein [Consotaella salsifontis]|uniref:Capsular polysaccharide export protein n=1 Tax=Consotaella salsifontis TaxID=1365950 RepID=A0A1T4PS12_9HYPH|nr:hypothetical protein [Consotaella salsifontis]SJZ94036.1 capsular polysaccharide export protein [Consotaella salsifontis]